MFETIIRSNEGNWHNEIWDISNIYSIYILKHDDTGNPEEVVRCLHV